MAAGRRGFALVIVLILVAAVFALAIQGGASMRATTIEAAALRDSARLEREARSAVAIALAGLTTPLREETGAGAFGGSGRAGDRPAPAPNPEEGPNPAELPELPPEIRELLGDLFEEGSKDDPPTRPAARDDRSTSTRARAGSNAFRLLSRVGLPAAPLTIAVGERSFKVTMMDAAGVLNVNTADERSLVAYFVAKGLPESVAQSIAQQVIDWRDPDDFMHPRGAERDEHLRRGVHVRNGPLQSVEELLYLPAMTREIFSLVREELTVAGDGRIHAGSAPRDVLLSLPTLTAIAAERIIELREAGGLTVESLRDALGIASREASESLRLEPTIYLRLRVEPQGVDGAPFAGEAVITNDGIRMIALRRLTGYVGDVGALAEGGGQ